MSNVLKGKASNVQMENLHGAVADLYGKGIEGIMEEHEQSVEYEAQLAEDEGREPKRKAFKLNKDDLALLSNATKFLKDNNVEMDVIKTSGSKAFSSKVQELADKKRKEALQYR